MTKVQRPIIHGRDHEHGGADPIRVHWESVGEGGGGGQAIFALTGGTFAVDGDITPLVLDGDSATAPTIHFGTTDTLTFAVTATTGRATILRPGFYVIGCQTNPVTEALISDDTYVTLDLKYADDGAGYNIEIPWLSSFFWAPGPPNIGQILGTVYVVPAGTTAGLNIGLQRLHPISLTEAATFPVEIQPTCNTNAAVATPALLRIDWLGLWGFRVGEPLSSTFSD